MARKEQDLDKKKKAILHKIDDECAVGRSVKGRATDRLSKITMFASAPLSLRTMFLYALIIVPALAVAIVSNGSELAAVERLISVVIVYAPCRRSIAKEKSSNDRLA